MKKKTLPALLSVLMVTTVFSCAVRQSTYEKKADEAQELAILRAALEGERDGLKVNLEESAKQKIKLEASLAYLAGQLDMVSQERDEARKRASELDKEIVRLMEKKDEQVQPVQKTSPVFEDLLMTMKAEVERGLVGISEYEGKISVTLVDSILFDSVKNEVKKGGEEVLGKVVSVLKYVESKSIQIEGHTDNMKISGSLSKRYSSNWELSSARAINVARFLQRQGIPGERLSAVAFGEWKPVADNSTPEGRARNRRIEITLVDKD